MEEKNIGKSGNLTPHLLWVTFSQVNETVLTPTGTWGCGSHQRLSMFSQYSLFPFCFSVLRVFEALLLYSYAADTITYAQQHCTSGTKQGGEVRQHLSADGTRARALPFSPHLLPSKHDNMFKTQRSRECSKLFKHALAADKPYRESVWIQVELSAFACRREWWDGVELFGVAGNTCI